MKEKRPSIIVICGPTATGKTSVSIKIAEKFRGEIVGADSMQIYKYLDIGTAKPTPEERARVKHHLVDVVDPREQFDAARYSKEARKAIRSILEKGNLPIVTGGTGLYIKTLLGGIVESAPVDHDLRHRLKREVSLSGSKSLHERLQALDPDTAARIHENDAYRIVRALEMIETNKISIKKLHDSHQFTDMHYRTLKIGITMEREALYRRIDTRVDEMIREGFVDEVQKLLNSGFSEDLKPMQSIGYRHIVSFLRGRISWDEALRTMKRDTRRYAKRQLTWFRADPEIIWKHPEEMNSILPVVTRFLQWDVT